MTAPQHLKVTGPEDILGFIPHSLGYWPENSLVAMTLQGKRLGATLRVDLPVLSGATGGAPGGAPGGAADAGRSTEGGPVRGRSGAARKPRPGPGPGPGSGPGDALAGYARSVASYVQADDAANGALLAIFSDADATGSGAGTGTALSSSGANASGDTVWRGLLKELELALEAAGMPVRDAWIVGSEFWWSAHCGDPACCAPPGRPVEEIRNSRMNAEMVFRGSSVGAAPGAADTLPVPGSADPAVRAAEFGWTAQFSSRRQDRAQFAQVLDVWTSVLQSAAAGEYPLGSAGPGCTDARYPGGAGAGAGAGLPDPDGPSAWAAGGAPKPSPELGGYLRASLCVPAWRDAVIVMAAAGRTAAERGAEDFGMFGPAEAAGTGTVPQGRAAPAQLAAPTVPAAPAPAPDSMPDPTPGSTPDSAPASGAGDVAGYGEVLLGLAPSVPDWAMMGALEQVLRMLGSLGGGESTAAAVTVRGWIEWCRGRGSYADALYRQALQCRPGYRLAELLAELGRRGTLCGWAARREAAWQKFAADAA